MKHRTTWKTWLALPLLMSAACGYVNLPPNATPQHAEYHAPAHDATTASVTLESIPEAIVVNPASSGNYLDADIDYLATINYSAAGQNDTYDVSLVERAQTLNYSGDPLTWNVGIDPALPLALDVTSSSGGQTLNLNDFTLTGFAAQTSSGRIDAHLPAGARYDAALETSSGSVTVALADEAAVTFTTFRSSSGSLTLNTGSGSTVQASFETSSGSVTLNTGSAVQLAGSIQTSSGKVALNFGARAAASLDVTTSSGAVTISLPSSAALRLQVDNNSSGSVTVPEWLQPLSGDSHQGVWESAGFAQAEQQIVVHILRDSSGAISVVAAS